MIVMTSNDGQDPQHDGTNDHPGGVSPAQPPVGREQEEPRYGVRQDGPPQYGQYGQEGPPQYGQQGAPQYGQQDGPPQYGQQDPSAPYGQPGSGPYGGQAPYGQPGPIGSSGAPAQQPYTGQGYQQPYGGQYGQTQQYGYGAQPRNGMGLAALIIAIVGLLFAWIPFIGLFGLVLGVVALVLGIMGVRRASRGEATNRGVAVSGIVISVIVILLGIASTAFATVVLDRVLGPEFQACVEQYGSNQTDLTRCIEDSMR